jgi:hypothetical protein
MRRELNGDRLRLEIMKRGLDQQSFARLAKIAPTTISAACLGQPQHVPKNRERPGPDAGHAR